MWVMNQDKITVADVGTLSIDYRDLVASQNEKEEERPKYYRVWSQVAEHDYVMGTYRTLEKAKAVIADFFSNLKHSSNFVYTMPVDDPETEKEVPAKEVA